MIQQKDHGFHFSCTLMDKASLAAWNYAGFNMTKPFYGFQLHFAD